MTRVVRFLVPAVLAAVLVAVGAGPAAAHVHVTAPDAVAGTGPVTLTFSAAAESETAGITGLRTRLPEGIAPADVGLATGPQGWALTPTDTGFRVGGPALPVGEGAEYAVTVTALPAGVTTLAFPTIQQYADGSEDAWIEPALPGAPEPERPAPVLAVAPGAPAPAATAPAATPSPAPTTTAPAPATEPAPDTAATPLDETGDGGTSVPAGAWWAGLLLLVALVGGAVLWGRRSRRRR
ncbi:DUF1775 domain-containing protein [Geodermatophilus marinus]|uniref:DUF1775 domain-containing protein n=1 Tax=Geodermatophilus sp. LHW52908 TaxID=2303986 RepID=UPI000E3D108B|nr:DUF1775 domain-containing protein [Geodermatophilus sp. LHW52908]RFU19635.1 DUF1775 domain-containing protein [Geodermatophilus sp. LHW52908]